MKPILHSIAGSALIFAIAESASAASTIAVNFNGPFIHETIEDGENTAALDALVGLNTPVWNNLTRFPDSGGVAAFASDETHGFNVHYHAGGGWSAGSEGLVTDTADASQQVFRGYLDDPDGGNSYAAGDGYGVTIQLGGLGAYLGNVGATSYNLTVFYNTDESQFSVGEIRRGNLSGGGAVADLPLVGTLTPTLVGNGTAPFSDPFPDMSGSWGAGSGTRAYVTIEGLTEDEVTLAFLSSVGGDVPRGSVAGFAITPVPEPGVSMLGLLGGAGLLRRRRR